MKTRVLIIGLGDLGRRIAERLVWLPSIELLLAGRSANGAALARLLDASGVAVVRCSDLDALDVRAVENLLRVEQPHLIVQCATLLSPWALSLRSDPAASAIRQAGFAAQTAMQLPILTNLMRAVRELDLQANVINCSYPDVTHAMLRPHGLQPTVGIGNADMIRRLVIAALRLQGRGQAPIRVAAHHSHVAPLVAGVVPPDPPLIWLGSADAILDCAILAGAAPLNADVTLNILSAASAASVVDALITKSKVTRLSLPGPSGLPGGWPVRIEDGVLHDDLPSGVSREDILALQARWACTDGVANISNDGTLHLTDAARDHLATIDDSLGEPLTVAEAPARAREFLDMLRL